MGNIDAAHLFMSIGMAASIIVIIEVYKLIRNAVYYNMKNKEEIE